MTARFTLALAALALTLGPAAAESDCWSAKHSVSAEAPAPAQSAPVDVAVLLPPVIVGDATDGPTPAPTPKPAE